MLDVDGDGPGIKIITAEGVMGEVTTRYISLSEGLTEEEINSKIETILANYVTESVVDQKIEAALKDVPTGGGSSDFPFFVGEDGYIYQKE